MFQAGQEIGSYKLIRKLGRGGFGEVWLAEKHSQLVTKKVAVKLPNDDQINIEGIRQEAELWEQASGHANVLPIIDADIYNGQIIIVSEYADGGSLHDKLQTAGKLPIKQTIEIIIGILSGLEFLHNKRIIHRDIKPQNILLQGETPRLADFGISRAMQTTNMSSQLVGTDAYMSPEAFDGKRSVQTDIWSVGVVLYQLLAGNLPFPQEHPSERIFAILTKEFPPLPDDVPNSLQKIVAKSLAKEPQNRYQTAHEMRGELQKALIGISHPTLAETEVLHIPNPQDTVTDVSQVKQFYKTGKSPQESVTNNPPKIIVTTPQMLQDAIPTQLIKAPLTENRTLQSEAQKVTEAQKVDNPTQTVISNIVLGAIGLFIIVIFVGVIGVILNNLNNSKVTNSSSNTASAVPINVELKTLAELPPLTVTVDGKDQTDSRTSPHVSNFTAQSNFKLEYTVYQVDKFQLKINGTVIKLSKAPPLGSYTSTLVVTKDNLNQILQNRSNDK